MVVNRDRVVADVRNDYSFDSEPLRQCLNDISVSFMMDPTRLRFGRGKVYGEKFCID